jgi:hypothetical protein
MEKIEFKLDGPSVIAPVRGCVLLARFQLVGRPELGSIFCDYGLLAGRSLQLFNCRAKTFGMDYPVPCDYALKVDAMTLPGERVVEMFQLQAPPWYYRLEADALALARQSQDLAEDAGLAGLFSSLTQ